MTREQAMFAVLVLDYSRFGKGAHVTKESESIGVRYHELTAGGMSYLLGLDQARAEWLLDYWRQCAREAK